MNWLSRFQNMVKALEEHPEVEVLDFHTFSPVELSKVEFLEEKYGVKIPSSFFGFYKETNGLQLRWVFKNNENYKTSSIQKNNRTFLDWDFFQKIFRWEDGGIMILPLEKTLEENIIDAFSQDYNSIFSKNNFWISVSEDESFSENFYTTDFESYLEFLIAGKGLISRRSFFYKKEKMETVSKIATPKSFWNPQRKLQLEQALLKEQFPYCDQVRFSQSQINRNTLKLIVENGEQVVQDDLKDIVEKHHQFLMTGGVGGEWKVLEIRGIVTAFYHQQKETEQGVQANFERKNLMKNNFENIELPYSNCCAIFAEGVNFSKSNFEGSLFTDSFLRNSNFYNSNFTKSDFSRGDLRGANFQNANLTNVDFENCDLRGVNFEGAKLDGARFVGCVLMD